ncbi:hypothetical protein VUR80DRAFT_1789 [Thermomyces stellatus]
MELKLRLASRDDVEALCETFFSGFADEFVAQRVFPSTSTSAWDFWRRDMTEGLRDPNAHMVVVEDTSATPPTMVAFAKWSVVAAGADLPPPPTEWPEGADHELGTNFFGEMWRKHKEIMRGQPHWYLELLSTKKEYQRKGAGRMLLRWGLDRADADCWDCFLAATPAGRGLYEKFGFSEVDERHRYIHSDGKLLQLYMRRNKRGE